MLYPEFISHCFLFLWLLWFQTYSTYTSPKLFYATSLTVCFWMLSNQQQVDVSSLHFMDCWSKWTLGWKDFTECSRSGCYWWVHLSSINIRHQYVLKKKTNVVEGDVPCDVPNSVSRAVVYTVLCTPLRYPVCIVFRTTESCMSIIDTYHHCIKMNWPSHLELVVEVYSSRIYVTNLYMILRDIISLK